MDALQGADTPPPAPSLPEVWEGQERASGLQMYVAIGLTLLVLLLCASVYWYR